MKLILITGAPYSGKGTQCDILSKQYNFTHVSTGERIRLEKINQTPLGMIMCEYEEKGNLVPDSLMKDFLGKIIDEHKDVETGFILDGYPRNVAQVDTLLELLHERGEGIYKIINIEVPTDELLQRAKKRMETSTRNDDKDPSLHIKRIEVFEEFTKPCVEYMKQKFNVVTINGMGDINEITDTIKKEVL